MRAMKKAAQLFGVLAIAVGCLGVATGVKAGEFRGGHNSGHHNGGGHNGGHHNGGHHNGGHHHNGFRPGHHFGGFRPGYGVRWLSPWVGRWILSGRVRLQPAWRRPPPDLHPR